jgi:hypothetical protein
MKLTYKIPIPPYYQKRLKSGKSISPITKLNIERRIKREVVDLFTRECLKNLHGAFNSSIEVKIL